MNDILFVGKHARTFNVARHFHQNWELIYCTGGSGEMVFNRHVIPYREHSLLVIPPRVPHLNRSQTGFTNIHMNIATEEMGASLSEPILLQLEEENHLQSAFEAAFYYYSNGGLGQSVVLPIYGQLIVAMIKTMNTDYIQNDVVRCVRDHILRNYPDAGFDLNAYLRTLPFSAEYLTRLFKNEMGMTPRQFLTDRRLENAASSLALMDGSLSVSQIARQCGFNDALYFSKVFKQRYGVSPKYYRPSNSARPSADSDGIKTILNDDSEFASS